MDRGLGEKMLCLLPALSPKLVLKGLLVWVQKDSVAELQHSLVVKGKSDYGA